jgi:hypothetical protein
LDLLYYNCLILPNPKIQVIWFDFNQQLNIQIIYFDSLSILSAGTRLKMAGWGQIGPDVFPSIKNKHFGLLHC